MVKTQTAKKEVLIDFRELVRRASIDFTAAIIEIDTGTRIGFDFDINPSEFLSFAKSDLREGGKRGKINALSNAKRAIDSQVDRIFRSLGHELDSYPNYFSTFANDLCEEKTDIPLKLRMINAFGMAPCLLISDIRTMRNRTEHQYAEPTAADVKTAVEIAELFLSATERHLMDVWDFQITDSSKTKDGHITGINFDLFKINESIKAWYYDQKTNEILQCFLKPTEFEHAILMRMCFLLDQKEEVLRTLKYLLEKINHPVPSKKVKVKVRYN